MEKKKKSLLYSLGEGVVYALLLAALALAKAIGTGNDLNLPDEWYEDED